MHYGYFFVIKNETITRKHTLSNYLYIDIYKGGSNENRTVGIIWHIFVYVWHQLLCGVKRRGKEVNVYCGNELELGGHVEILDLCWRGAQPILSFAVQSVVIHFRL